MKFRLSLLLFLMFGAMGSWVPMLTVHLDELQFNPLQIGLASATMAMAYLAAPLAAGQVADRWIAAERCIAVGSAMCGSLMCLLATLEEPVGVIWTLLALWLVMVPVQTISNALVFTHVGDPARHFGRVRMWGTIGWVVAAWAVGIWLELEPCDWLGDLVRSCGCCLPARPLVVIFYVGAAFSFALAGYALTLPHTPPKRRGQNWLALLQALPLLKERAFAVYLIGSLVLYTTLPFSGQVTPLLLKALEIPEADLPPILTIAQLSEVVMLAMLPAIWRRLGLRGTMQCGLMAWTVVLLILAMGQPTWLVVAAPLGNGVQVACFMVAGQMFVDSRAAGHIRASAQSLLVFVNGLGLLAGNLLAGQIREWTEPAFSPTFLTAAGMALALVLFFLAGFRPEATPRPKPP